MTVKSQGEEFPEKDVVLRLRPTRKPYVMKTKMLICIIPMVGTTGNGEQFSLRKK